MSFSPSFAFCLIPFAFRGVSVSDDLLLELADVRKSFGATRALRGVGMCVRRGEVHALIGENGAGKSTLMKILSGALRADEGVVRFRGAERQIDSPAAGRALGIAMIYQELTLAPHLDAETNIMLGIERTRLGFVRPERERVREALALLRHADLPLDIPVRRLGIGQRQIVEIARALVSNASLIIMDEPTSSLSAEETEALFEAIGRLKRAGIAIIYISHFLEEVARVADSYTVLRDGESVGSGPIAGTAIGRLVELMVGRTLREMFPRVEHDLGEEVLRVEGLEGVPLPRGVALSLRAGEIFGIAGLVGAGRSETLRSLFGLRRVSGGEASFRDGRRRALRSATPRKALADGLNLLSENRKEEGLATAMSVAANTTFSALRRFAGWRGCGLISLRRERQAVERWIGELGIRCQGPGQPVAGLSGGNQQKVALARILEHDSDVLLLDEPTRGVDVGSKVEIYRWIGQLAARGKGIVFVSSYLPELLGVCDTLAVMHRGRLSAKKTVADWTEHEIMRLAAAGGA